MTKLMLLAARYPWVTLTILFIITSFFLLPLPRLSVDVSPRALLPADGEVKELYDYVQSYYGTNASTLIVVSDDKLFFKNHLESLVQAIDAIESLPFVLRIHSLFSVPNVQVVDDFVHTDPYLKKLPETESQRVELVQAALFNPWVAGSLLSADGKTMAIGVEFVGNRDHAWKDTEVVRGVEQIIAPLRNKFDQVIQIGGPRVRDAIAEHIKADQIRIIPLSVGVLLLTLALLLRSVTAALLPLLTAGLSIVWTLGLMAGLGISLGVISAIIPALLVIIGSTEDIHLLSEYRNRIAQGEDRGSAVKTMGRRMSAAVSLTAATTYAGFLSIALNDLQMLREFGLLASTGLLFNFLITVTLVPAMLSLVGPHRMASPANRDGVAKHFATFIVAMASNNRFPLLGGTILVLGVFLYGASSLHINNDSLNFFSSNDQVVRDIHLVEERLTGIETFSVVIHAGIMDTFLKVRYLEAVSRLQRRISELPEVDHTQSFADYMALINTVMVEEEDDQLYLPDTDDMLREYALFIRPEHVKPYVLNDYSETRIVVHHRIRSSEALEKLLAEIRDIAGMEMEPGLSVSLTGASVLSAHAARGMARGQAQSLVLMVAMIFIVVSVLFWTPWAGVVAVVPNIVPIVALFGVMGFMGIPLDNGTAMVAAIALGICVDDSMHFLVRYHENSRSGAEELQALSSTVREELSPIVATSIALALGFSVLALSDFPPVARFGLLSAMVMLLALTATFLLAPVMLTTVKLITLWEVLSLRLRSEVISHCTLFSGLKPRQIKHAVLLGGIANFKNGSYVVRQGEVEKRMYVVLEGEVEVWKARKDGSRDMLALLKPGDVIGEIALVSDLPRSTDVKATEDTRLLTFDWQGLRRIARKNPIVATLLFRNLSNILATRLVDTEEQRLPFHDPHTGVFSLSYFKVHLGVEIERARRFSDPLALLVFEVSGGWIDQEDIRQKKHVEETILKIIVDNIREAICNADLLARLSGNRFIIMLGSTGTDSAIMITEKLESEIGKFDNYSLITAVVDHHPGEQPEQFIARAETALDGKTKS